jgi:hypothetical protein
VSYIRLHAYQQAFVETVSYSTYPSALVCPAILRAAEPGRRPSPYPHSASPSSPIPAFPDVGHVRTAGRSRVGQLCFVEEGRTTGAAIRDRCCDKGREECCSPEDGGASWRPPVTGFRRPLPWLPSLSTKSHEQTWGGPGQTRHADVTRLYWSFIHPIHTQLLLLSFHLRCRLCRYCSSVNGRHQGSVSTGYEATLLIQSAVNPHIALKMLHKVTGLREFKRKVSPPQPTFMTDEQKGQSLPNDHKWTCCGI